MLILLKHANDGGAAGPSLPGPGFPPLFTQTAPVNFDTRRRKERDRKMRKTEEEDKKTKEHKRHSSSSNQSSGVYTFI